MDSAITEKMQKFLKDADIHGCFVIMREDADGNGVAMNYAADKIRELNVLRGAASVIVNLTKGKKANFHKLILRAAQDICILCDLIDDLAAKGE